MDLNDTIAEALGLDGQSEHRGWTVIDAVRECKFTGEVRLRASGLDALVYADQGRVYFAHLVEDAPLGDKLVESGVLTVEQRQRGGLIVGPQEYLGRLFERDRSIDPDRVRFAVELLTQDCVAVVSAADVSIVAVSPYRHHAAGIHRWEHTGASGAGGAGVHPPAPTSAPDARAPLATPSTSPIGDVAPLPAPDALRPPSDLAVAPPPPAPPAPPAPSAPPVIDAPSMPPVAQAPAWSPPPPSLGDAPAAPVAAAVAADVDAPELLSTTDAHAQLASWSHPHADPVAPHIVDAPDVPQASLPVPALDVERISVEAIPIEGISMPPLPDRPSAASVPPPPVTLAESLAVPSFELPAVEPAAPVVATAFGSTESSFGSLGIDLSGRFASELAALGSDAADETRTAPIDHVVELGSQFDAAAEETSADSSSNEDPSLGRLDVDIDALTRDPAPVARADSFDFAALADVVAATDSDTDTHNGGDAERGGADWLSWSTSSVTADSSNTIWSQLAETSSEPAERQSTASDAVIEWDDAAWLDATLDPRPGDEAGGVVVPLAERRKPSGESDPLVRLAMPEFEAANTAVSDGSDPLIDVGAAWIDRLAESGLADLADPNSPSDKPSDQLPTNDRFGVVWPSGEVGDQLGVTPVAPPLADQFNTTRIVPHATVEPAPAGVSDVSDARDSGGQPAEANPDTPSLRDWAASESARESVADDIVMAVRRAVASIEGGSLSSRRRTLEPAQALGLEPLPQDLPVRDGRSAVGLLEAPDEIAPTGGVAAAPAWTGGQQAPASSVFDSGEPMLPTVADTRPARATMAPLEPTEPERQSALRRLIGSLRNR